MLHEYKTVFWIDACVRFTTSNLESIHKKLNGSRGIVLPIKVRHSIFAATHAEMYKYLPMTKPKAVKFSMVGAGAIYIHCTQEVITRFII
jgi:hypothetical protein